MTLGGYITLLASLAGIGAMSASQDPTFESPTFAPVFAPEPGTTAPYGDVSVYQQSSNQKLVSVTFTGAGVREVVDWLTKQGVNFMLNESALPTDKKISLNLVEQPLNVVVDALGDALGGHWEPRGQILVFRNGAGLRRFQGLGTESAGGWNVGKIPQMEGIEKGMFEKGLMSDKDWQAFNKTLQQKYRGRQGNLFMQPGFNFDSRALEKSLSNKDWTKLSEAQAKEMAQMSKNLMKELDSAKFKDLEKSGMSQKEMDKLRETLKKQMSAGMKEGQLMDAKAAEKMAREMQGKMKFDPSMIKGWDGAKNFDPTIVKGWEGGNFDLGGQDLPALAKSLTREQRELQKRQGFLRVGDLTPAQRRYLGHIGSDGDWTLKYQNGKDEITIKSGRS